MVLDKHPDEVKRFRSGEERLYGFFMGQVMRAFQVEQMPRMSESTDSPAQRLHG